MQRGKINTDIETSESWVKNTFLLKRLSMTANSPSLQVDFSPIQKQSSSSDLEHAQTTMFDSFPKFNKDVCYFTPAFILDIDKEKYISNHQSYLSLHLSKRQELTQQKAQLFVPKPSKSNSFCCICKAIFDDYLTHVNIPKHQELMRSSDFTESIKNLCGKFKKEEVEEISEVKVAKIKKRIQKNRKKQKEQRCDSMSTKGNIQVFDQMRKQIII